MCFICAIQDWLLVMKTLHARMNERGQVLGKDMLPCLRTKGPRLTPSAGRTTIVRRLNSLRHQVSMLQFCYGVRAPKGYWCCLRFFVMSRCFTRGCRAVTDSAIWTVGGIFDPRWRYTWIKRCRSVIYSHDWTVSGIFKPGRSDKRLVFVFLCRALIMNIFRKYNMRVWCLFRVCIGKGVPSMLATAENSPLINLTGLSTVSTNHAQDSPTNKILTPKG